MREIPVLETQLSELIAKGKTDEAKKMMNQYSADFAASTAQTWKNIEQQLWETFWTGF